MTPKIATLEMTPIPTTIYLQNFHTLKVIIFLKSPQDIEIQDFQPKKAYTQNLKSTPHYMYPLGCTCKHNYSNEVMNW